MSHILGLRTTIYKVGNLSEAKEWYARAFDVQPYFDEPFYTGFNIGGYELGLLPDDLPQTQKTCNVTAYWGLNDIDAQYNRLLELGATEHKIPENVGGDIKTAALKDPGGNLIGIIYNPEFKLDNP